MKNFFPVTNFCAECFFYRRLFLPKLGDLTLSLIFSLALDLKLRLKLVNNYHEKIKKLKKFISGMKPFINITQLKFPSNL